MKTNNVAKLLGSIAACELAGGIGSIFTASSIANWYAGLPKPALTPPSWVFGPVWTALFALMGIAAYMVWTKGLERRDVKIALGVFGGQLVLNMAWSAVFFGLRNPAGGVAVIVLLWLAIAASIFLFYKISRPAAWLMVPYLLWVTFAGYLNYSIWNQTASQNQAVACTEEAKACPDGSYVGRTGPLCEFAACPETLAVPKGYTTDAYSVEKVSEVSCQQDSECQTPAEYMIQSRCPFVSLCVQNRCTVVCPARQDITWREAETLIRGCRVRQMSQLHSRSITLVLKDGRRFESVEPEIDRIILLSEELRDSCGPVPVATE